MLTRLRVSGFKNLVDVDVRFGPFTCIAGINGVGKSNVLDAILFLSALADRPLADAALSVRDEGGRTGDVRGLFNHVADWFAGEMSFQAEMIIPETGLDDLGQKATASSTLVQYSVTLRFRDDDSAALSPLELIKEELAYINKGDAPSHLLFAHSKDWFESAVKNRRRGEPYISTEIPDPKDVLLGLIRQASGLNSRRTASLKLPYLATRVVDCIDDFNHLHPLTAFASFQNDLRAKLDRLA